MYKLKELLKDAGVSSFYNEGPANIETVERCRQCKKGFKSRWGYIYKCKDHEFLEEIHMPPVFSSLRKKAAEKRNEKADEPEPEQQEESISFDDDGD